MTGKFTVGSIQDTDGNTVASTYVTNGVAKVLEKHDESYNIDNSMNVSTLTDNGNGDTTVNYTNSIVNIHQYVVAGAGNDSTQNRIIQNIAAQTHTASSHRYKVANSAFTAVDTAINNSVVHGDLA